MFAGLKNGQTREAFVEFWQNKKKQKQISRKEESCKVSIFRPLFIRLARRNKQFN